MGTFPVRLRSRGASDFETIAPNLRHNTPFLDANSALRVGHLFKPLSTTSKGKEIVSLFSD